EQVLEVHAGSEAEIPAQNAREVGDRSTVGRYREGRLNVEDVVDIDEEAETLRHGDVPTPVEVHERVQALMLAETRLLVDALIHRPSIVEVGEQRDRAVDVVQRRREAILRIAERSLVMRLGRSRVGLGRQLEQVLVGPAEVQRTASTEEGGVQLPRPGGHD